jgi:transposase InsO family protein
VQVQGKTQSVQVNIGERRKPEPDGRPGFLRVDTVHQGDVVRNGKMIKSLYHINLVDEITQYQVVFAVEGISESFLKPVIEAALTLFPFVVINFHSDNGSEFINKTVAELLNKLLITQTKSRPRRSNDNGLAESKNGSTIRKHLGALAHSERVCSTSQSILQKPFYSLSQFLQTMCLSRKERS